MKESGVKCIGKVPVNWNIRKYKNFCIVYAGGTPDTGKSEYWDGDIPWIQSGKVQNSDVCDCSRYITKIGFKNSSTKYIPKCTPLLAMTGATCGNVGFLQFDSCANQSIMAFIPSKEINSRYLFYSLMTQYDIILTLKTGGAQSGINIENGKNLFFSFPHLQEQKNIANYLDEKVSLIDNIIAQTTLSIEEYKKYKQSVITEIVTKGLNFNIEMKHSGIQWIGEIPKEWSLIKLNYVFNLIGSGTTPKSDAAQYYNGDCYWIQSGDINGSIINNTKKKITQLALNNISTLKFYKSNFIVVAMYGASIANVSISNIEACVNQACCVLSEPIHNLRYVFYCIKASKEYFITLASGGTQPNISQETIKQIKIPIPFIKEQEQMVIYLDKKCSEIDNIITQKQQLLIEIELYKKSFIYECVTGKREVI